jgi:RING finger protein 113A
MADTEATTAPFAPSETPVAPVALFKKRTNKNIRKRAATPPPASSDSDYTSSEDEAGHKIKRRKRNTGAVIASSKPSGPATDLTATVYEAKRDGITSVNDATKSAEWFDEGKDGAMSAKNLLGSTRAMPSTSTSGTYAGLAAQKSQTFIQKSADAPNRSIGPIKAPSNIRTITVTDFAPDVCKDYKTTGFCGFGDNCKYLHAREDYKAGWQLDREWENVTKGKKDIKGTTVASASKRGEQNNEEEEDEEAMLEGIPFVCIICRESYKQPIVTRCGHYFCEGCALKRYRKDPSCAACGSGTGGVFNVAKNLRKLLDRKREMRKKRREEAREAGEEVSSTDEEED